MARAGGIYVAGPLERATLVIDASDEEQKLLGVRFNPEVTLGHILQAAIAAAGVMSVIWVFAARVDTTVHDFTAFRTDVVGKIGDLKSDMQEQFRSVRRDITNIPDMRAGLNGMERRLESMEKRMDQTDNRAGAQSERISHIEGIVLDQRRQNQH